MYMWCVCGVCVLCVWCMGCVVCGRRGVYICGMCVLCVYYVYGVWGMWCVAGCWCVCRGVWCVCVHGVFVFCWGRKPVLGEVDVLPENWPQRSSFFDMFSSLLPP